MIPGPHVEDDGGGSELGRRVADDGGDEGEDEVPEGFQFLALHDVEDALFPLAANHSADRRLRLVALPVAYKSAAVEQFAPVPLFGGIGDRGAERFPDFIPWDAGVGEAVVYWCLGSGLAHSASLLGRRPRMCGVVKCLVMLLMLRWVRLVMHCGET